MDIRKMIRGLMERRSVRIARREAFKKQQREAQGILDEIIEIRKDRAEMRARADSLIEAMAITELDPRRIPVNTLWQNKDRDSEERNTKIP